MIDNHGFHSSVRLAEDPTDHVGAYCTTFARGSGELLDNLYEPNAVLVPQPGHMLSSAAERIGAHNHLLGFGLPLTAQARHVYVADEIALLIVDWSIQGTSRQGYPVDLRGTATDIARRGPDSQWRYVIDNPFGAG
jgi:ketosteroid isomerase-like protein